MTEVFFHTCTKNTIWRAVNGNIREDHIISRVKVNVDICKVPLNTKAFSKALRYGNTVLPANKPYLPLLPSHRASPPFGWYSFYRPTEDRRLSRPGEWSPCGKSGTFSTLTLLDGRQEGRPACDNLPQSYPNVLSWVAWPRLE